MRVVIDTNVFVSGVFFGGPPGRVLTAWRDGEIEMFVTREIVEEYVRVGHELAAHFPAVELGPALDLVATCATMVAAPPLPRPVCRDRDDDKFVACAVSAEADYVISGDGDLVDVSHYQGVLVVRPRAFVDLVTQHEPGQGPST